MAGPTRSFSGFSVLHDWDWLEDLEELDELEELEEPEELEDELEIVVICRGSLRYRQMGLHYRRSLICHSNMNSTY